MQGNAMFLKNGGGLTGTLERRGLEWRGLGIWDDGFTTVRVSGAGGCGNGGMQDPWNALLGTLGSEHAGMLERRKPATRMYGAPGYWQDGMQERRVSGAVESAVCGFVDCWRGGYWQDGMQERRLQVPWGAQCADLWTAREQ
eukprot:gene15408-biopygen3681